ncbi:MAG: SH3 domain-containing protein [Thermodesulfobacteriota bacterium]
MGSERMMSIQIKNGQLRKTPSFLGQNICSVSYGDQVRFLSEEAGWIKVALPGKKIEGWIHHSALTEKKIVIQKGTSQVPQKASGEELALAGKGFNKQVEDQFRARNRNMNFALIDEMEKRVVSPGEIKAFINEGRLNPRGGLL